MKPIIEYLSTKVAKPSTIKATDYTINKIVKDELDRLGYDADLNHIDTSKVTKLNKLFMGESRPKINCDISKWNVSNVKSFDMAFSWADNFDGDLSEWDVSSGVSFNEMFLHTKIDFDMSNWNMSNASFVGSMFNYCYNFTGKGLENWDTSRFKNCDSMFNNCQKFNQDLSNWDVSNVYEFSHMFEDCYKFTGKGLDKWDIKSATRLYKTFMCCKSLDTEHIDFSKWLNHYCIDESTFKGTPFDKSGTIYL